MVAVGVAESQDRPPADETVDAHRLARAVVDELDLRLLRSTGPVGRISNFMTPLLPTTCSGGMP